MVNDRDKPAEQSSLEQAYLLKRSLTWAQYQAVGRKMQPILPLWRKDPIPRTRTSGSHRTTAYGVARQKQTAWPCL